MSALDLGTREGLPDALRVLLDEYPRDAWETHPEFGQLTQFWLHKHLTFRKLLAMLTDEAQGALDGKLAVETHAARVSRLGGMLYGDLHGHHNIEDAHYFPALVRLEPQIEAGFDLLERDHEAMDGLLARFAETANAVIGAGAEPPAARRNATGAFLKGLEDFRLSLDRHLVDEEEIIVPVLLKHGERALGG